MTYQHLLTICDSLEEACEQMPAETSNVAHFARIELANAIVRAREILEALAHDEEKAQ